MTTPAPTRTRLDGLDAARALALAGMVLVNVGPVEPQNALHRLYLLPYGRASILFVVIAGVGMGLMARSARAGRGLGRIILWRAALLLVGGLALQLLSDDVSIILPLYGLLFLLALPLRRLPTRGLLAVAGVMTVLGPVAYVMHGVLEDTKHLTAPPRLDDPLLDVLHGLVLSGRYPLVTWVVPFIIGLVLARLNLRDQQLLRRIVVVGGVTAVAGFLLSQATRSILAREADIGYARLLTGAAHGQMPLWLLSSVGGALFVIAGALLLAPRAGRLTAHAATVGRMALTLYVLHVLVIAAVQPPDGFTIAQGAAVTVVLVATLALFALGWSRFAPLGPLETVLRAEWLRPPVPTVPTPASAPTTAAGPTASRETAPLPDARPTTKPGEPSV